MELHHKICSKCKKDKLLSEFNSDSRTKDKLTFQCKKCRAVNSKSYYERNKSHCALVDKEYNLANRSKIRDRQRKYNKLNPDKQKKRRMKYEKTHKSKRRMQGILYRHGLSEEAYLSLMASQNNRCAICLKDFSLVENSKNIHVDHDHKTGKIRSILCGKCNVALGHVDDNIDILYKMISYLITHSILKEREIV